MKNQINLSQLTNYLFPVQPIESLGLLQIKNNVNLGFIYAYLPPSF